MTPKIVPESNAPWWVKSGTVVVERLGLPTVLCVAMLWVIFGFVMRDMKALADNQKELLQTQATHRQEMNALVLDSQINSRLINAQMERMVKLAQLQCVYLATTNPQRAACLNAAGEGK